MIKRLRLELLLTRIMSMSDHEYNLFIRDCKLSDILLLIEFLPYTDAHGILTKYLFDKRSDFI